jgi:hypothetical protein
VRAPALSHRLTPLRAVAISALVAAFFAFLSVTSISVTPPGIAPRHMEIGVAATHVMFDEPESLLVAGKPYRDFPIFTKRASLYGDILGSRPVVERMARTIGVAPDHIATVSRVTGQVDRVMREPNSEQRANKLLTAQRPYGLEIQSDTFKPIVHIYAQAPSPAAAVELANASVVALGDFLQDRSRANGTDADYRVRLDQLGTARGGATGSKTAPVLVALTFVVVFGIALVLVLAASRLRAARRASATDAPVPATETNIPRLLSPAAAVLEGIRRRTAFSTRGIVDADADWPRTSRALPWTIAGFIAILWLVPFNVIQLSGSLPFDLKFDRLVLPVLCGAWILALAGGRHQPRVRITPIHVGIFLFTAIACVGVLLNAHDLHHTLEFEQPVKKLILLISYGLLFVLVASSVRRSEVPAFMKYTLGLAVLCALGVIWEYRFRYNVFHVFSDALLPGVFQVTPIDPNEIDDIGRRMTRGPAEHPLETVAMLSMALPIALVAIIHGTRRRDRLLYGLAACILLAAAISTYRKSALLAPLAVVLTIAYFRRRELLRLAPLAALSLVFIHALSPGALGSILFQLDPERLAVSTVSDRSSDYDAIRPDVWTHLGFGRGYGSFDHVNFRILDSEILSRLVDTGILGLLALVLMLASILLTARRPIWSRHPLWSPPALAVAAATVAYFVLTFLFDVSSFPHTPYILMALAGLLAAVVTQPVDDAAPRPRAAHHIELARRSAPRDRRAAHGDHGRGPALPRRHEPQVE